MRSFVMTVVVLLVAVSARAELRHVEIKTLGMD
jgi:hypothetical protein